MTLSEQHQDPRGFTLLEIVLAVGIITILAGSILAISASALGLTSTLVSVQELRIRSDDTEAHIRNNFSSLSPESRFQLSIGGVEGAATESGISSVEGTQSFLITNPGVYFPFEGKDILATETVLTTTLNADGLPDLVQVYVSASDDGGESHSYTISLLKDLELISWEFYQASSRGWVTEWESGMRLPNQIKFNYQKEGEITQSMFIWLSSN